VIVVRKNVKKKEVFVAVGHRGGGVAVADYVTYVI